MTSCLLLFFSFIIVFVESGPVPLVRAKNTTYDATVALYPAYVLYHDVNTTRSKDFYDAFSTALKNLSHLGITAAEVNCTEYRRLCRNQGVKRPPELRRFHRRGHYAYKGEPDADNITEWISKEMKKGHRIFRRMSDIEALFPEYDTIFIGQFEDRKNIEFQVWESCAGSPKENSIMTTLVNPRIDKQRLTFHNLKENFTEKYKGKWDWGALTTWMNQVQSPFVEEITSENSETIFKGTKPFGFYVYDGKTDDVEFIKKEATKIGKKYRHQIQLLTIDHNKHWRVTPTLGLPGTHFPAFSILAPFPSNNPLAKAHYPLLPNNTDLPPTIAFSAVSKHVKDFLDGKLPVNIRSEPAPAEQAKKVVRVVGDTFNTTILDHVKNVFVLFHAPWCHKCKRLLTQLEEVAGEIGENVNLVIAEFDDALNDRWPYYHVENYPTLLLFPEGDKLETIRCEHVNSIQKIRRFLNENIPKLTLSVNEKEIMDEDERDKKRAKMEKKMGIDRNKKKKWLYEEEL